MESSNNYFSWFKVILDSKQISYICKKQCKLPIYAPKTIFFSVCFSWNSKTFDKIITSKRFIIIFKVRPSYLRKS